MAAAIVLGRAAVRSPSLLELVEHADELVAFEVVARGAGDGAPGVSASHVCRK
jgi:hypothetical protein